jgi:hypothetical protein
MKEKLLLFAILLLCHYGFAQTGFEENAITNSMTAPEDMLSFDIDNDGDLDILSFSPSRVVWFENGDGQGSFSAHRVVSTSVSFVQSAYAADVDGDGDLDVLSASSEDDKVAWYENTDGLGTFGPQQMITSIADRPNSVYAADLDGDGDMDVLSASADDNKIAWYENMDGLGTFGTQQVISLMASGAKDVRASDIDGDGDMDIISSSRTDKKIAWYENTDGLGTFGTQQIITTSAIFLDQLFVIDMDGDGDMDVMSDFGNAIAWFENTDGLGTFGSPQTIGSTFSTNGRSFPADFDGDGDIDVFAVSPLNPTEKIVWYENTDGQGTYSSEQVIASLEVHPNYVHANDLDGDGDNEVIFSSYWGNKIAWYENTDGQGSVGPQRAVTSLADNPSDVYVSDIDGDGDKDILSASFSDDKIAWYENTNGQGHFEGQQVITTAADGANSVYATDIDGDGDMDILSTSGLDNKVAWYENTDGQGTFGPQQIITTLVDFPNAIFATDLDGDGDMDVLSASSGDNKIAWYENVDGQGTFGFQQVISTNAAAPGQVYAVDVDGDGDIDVLSSSYNDNKIAWYENVDGQGTFGPQQVITTQTSSPSSVYAIDLDNDGDIDVLSSSQYDNKIAWYENMDGQGTFGTQQIITSTASHATSVYATDVDGDGDIDVLSASRNDDTIAWYENTDGQGTFGVSQIITTNADNPSMVYANDINGDGAMDVLSLSSGDDKIAWYRNLGTISNEINGKLTLDVNSNGCDASDLPIGNVLIETTDGTTSLSTFSLPNGVYQLFPDAGSFTTSVISPLANYYTVSPTSATSNFTGVGNTDTADFCLQPTGTHNDLNITIYPSIDDPRPGFNTTYQIVYTNVGTTQLSGDITFEFDDGKMQFLSASEAVNAQTASSLTFNFTNLSPFETRTIDLGFNVFPPPTTNIDDILVLTATINPITGDETPGDNIYNLRQTVIGSYDPNDIRVLEGEEILIDDIDKYLHYIIRFQNTGTASAINVRVEHVLDSKLDWTTMQLQSLSHAGQVEITNGNNVEFIFDNINLPDSTTDEPNSHGYITFKIKPKSDVMIGDVISGTASIYFDFNPPIITNTATTTIIQRLSVEEFEANKVSIYPNPTNGRLNIKTKNNIKTILVYDLNGRLLINKELNENNSNHELDVSDLSSGFYFLEIKTDTASQVVKFIRD